MDDVHAQEYEVEDASQRRGGPPKGLETTMKLLKGCTSNMVVGQWRPMEAMLRRALEEDAPKLMGHLQIYAALNPGMEGLVDKLRIGADETLGSADRCLENLLPEIDLILIRVQSCFDFEASVAK